MPVKLRLLLRSRRVSPAPDVLTLGNDEADGRAAITAEEHRALWATIASSRLEVTELVCRARVWREHTLELRASGQQLRLISLELLQREAVRAMECIQWLELEERCGLWVAEQCLCNGFQALFTCHAVWFGLQRLRGLESAARGGIASAAHTLGKTILEVCREPLLRDQLLAAETLEWGLLSGSRVIQLDQHCGRRCIEATAAAEQPDIDVWLLVMAAQRERLRLLACQRLERSEIVERRKAGIYRLAMIHWARQQCVRPFIERQLAILQRREAKERRLIAAWETVPRAVLSAQRTLHIVSKKRRKNVLGVERQERRWLCIASACALEAYSDRQRVATKQEQEWGRFLHSALPIVEASRIEALQNVEARQRTDISAHWQLDFGWMDLSAHIAEEENTLRGAIWQQFLMDSDVFALQRKELNRRHNAAQQALRILETLFVRFQDVATCLQGVHLGRRLVSHVSHCEWARLLLQHCQEWEVVCRLEVERSCLGFLRLQYRLCAVELTEFRARSPLEEEQTIAFILLQIWWDVTYRLEQEMSSAYIPVAKQEEQERCDLYHSARISFRMAKVSCDLRLTQENRAREGTEYRKGVERRGGFLTVPSLGEMDLALISPARLNVQTRTPRSQRGSPRRSLHRITASPVAVSLL